MALVLGKETALQSFELAFKSAWAGTNDDGVGCYWRDYPKEKTGEEKHLARFKDSRDMARVERSYDRMLIHFRKATRGEGTYPFICRDRQDLKSGNWLLVHNGSVQDTNARLMLRDKHVMASEIDSEVFIHIWADINESNLEKRAKKFTEKVKEMDITGWANLIFYNFETDEWVAMAESSLGISKTKDGSVVVVSSDRAWLDESQAKKLGIKFEEMPYGAIAYGRGTTYKTKTHVWKITGQTQMTSYYQDAGNGTYRRVYSDDDIWDVYGGAVPPEAWEPKDGKSKPFNQQNFNKAIARGAHWDAKMRAMVDKNGRPLDFDDYADPSCHEFVPTSQRDDSGMPTCDVCMMSLPYHNILKSLTQNRAAQREEQAEDHYDKWDKRHPFTRDFNYPTIQCMCGTKSSFSVLHLAHDFKKLGGSDYCQDCGQSKAIGNHKEDSPQTHFYQEMKLEDEDPKSGKRFYSETGTCGRCGFAEAMHPMNDLQHQKREVVVVKQRPMGCDCRPQAGAICHTHHKQGFTGFDKNGMLVKERVIEFSMGNGSE